MSLRKKSIKYTLIFTVVAIVIFIVNYQTNNIFKCERLQVGDSIEKVVKELGEPYKQESEGEIKKYYFSSGVFAAGPIRIETLSGKVTKLQCSED